MGFYFKATKRSANCQMALGSLCFGFGILDRVFIYKDVRRAFHTEGVIAILTGIWFFITGIIGYYASHLNPHNQEPNKSMINTYLGFSVVATVFAGVLLICYSLGLVSITNGRPCSENERQMCSFDSDGRYYCFSGSKASECQKSVGLGAIIIIFGIAEFGVSIWASICCCTNGCCDSSPPQRQVVYLQNQGGPVAAYVMTEGPNGTPVAVPAMTGGPVYQPPNQAAGGQAYMMQNPQGATAVTPTGAEGHVHVKNSQGATTEKRITTDGDQPPAVKTTDASSEPPPIYTP